MIKNIINSPTFGSRVLIPSGRYSFNICAKHQPPIIREKLVKDIKALENNGVDDIVILQGQKGVRDVVHLTVQEQRNNDIYIGESFDYITNPSSCNLSQIAVDIKKLYIEAKANMELNETLNVKRNPFNKYLIVTDNK